MSFGFLIMGHELGHFISARKLGIRVDEFCIGLGPTLFKKKIGGTIFKLSLIPIGGYIKMPEKDLENSGPGILFKDASAFSKAIVLAAGSFANIFTGLILLLIISLLVTTGSSNLVKSVNYDQISFTGIEKLKMSDKIIEVASEETTIGDDVLSSLVPGATQKFLLERNGEKISVEAVVSENIDYSIIAFEERNIPVPERLVNGFVLFGKVSKMMCQSILDLFQGKYSIKDLSGPIGLTAMIGESIQVSISSFLIIISLIAINIGIFNLMPLPALDGARIVFLLIEAGARRQIPHKVQERIHSIGMMLLLCLIIIVTFNDISGLIPFSFK